MIKGSYSISIIAKAANARVFNPISIEKIFQLWRTNEVTFGLKISFGIHHVVYRAFNPEDDFFD
jgi:hypothetical protein